MFSPGTAATERQRDSGFLTFLAKKHRGKDEGGDLKGVHDFSCLNGCVHIETSISLYFLTYNIHIIYISYIYIEYRYDVHTHTHIYRYICL